ncbi:fimbrial protein [Pseudomonas sp. PGPR81]|uniref:fimbrial protein n=1 Tax=Pseudomonas sp. PGPR81 TaxID=2913477 RepID=UPI001EDB1713|nr:fimbrial protein [Pseudomonas sp. PGPR81]
MKKSILALTLIALTASTITANAATDGGTINFQGQVVETTCQASFNGSKNPTIILPTVSTKAVNESDTAGWTKISVKMECDSTPSADYKVSTFFYAPSTGHVNSSGNLRNQTSDDGSNAGLSLYLSGSQAEASASRIDFNNFSSTSTPGILWNGGNGLQFTPGGTGPTSGVDGFDIAVSYAKSPSAPSATTQGLVTSEVLYTIIYP